MLSISTGHSAGYLTDQVGAGMESYYTGAVVAGEPPGVWWGRAATTLGLHGEVDAEVMHAIYGEFLDPRDPAFVDPGTRAQSVRLGRAPKRYRTPEQVVADRVRGYTESHAGVTPDAEQVQAWLLEAERDTPKAVGFYDATFSPDKSVTVLWVSAARAAHDARDSGDEATAERWQQLADGVEAAVMEAGAAGLAYLEEKACIVRTGRHGTRAHTGRWEQATGFTVARFLQHTSRDLDPQLHVHQAILNRAQTPDGTWRALDSKALHSARAGAAAISERTMEALLTQWFGIVWEDREDGLGRRVAEVMPEIEDLFSSRRQAITAGLAQRIASYEQAIGRAANNLERTRLAVKTTLASRRGKTHQGETSAEQHQRWDAEAQTQVAGGLTRQAELLVAKVPGIRRFLRHGLAPADRSPGVPVVEGFSPAAVIAAAVEACHGPDGRSTFTRHDLIRQLDLHLPANLGLAPEEIPALLEQLADQALAPQKASRWPFGRGEVAGVVQVAGRPVGDHHSEIRACDQTPVTVNPSGVRYAARGHLAAEMAVLGSAGVRGRHALNARALGEWLDQDPAGSTLSVSQRAALEGIACSDAALSVLVGPAGTGKSYTAGVLDQVWRHHTGTGRVVGVAITQAAADVLADDGITASANVAAFLAAHTRITQGRGQPYDRRWNLSKWDLVLVDEASMLDTGSLTRLHDIVEAAGARLVLMGDPHQLSAVGASGMMAAAIERDAETYTLSEVRRFTQAWEREASLALRAGHADAVGEYDRRGRVVDGGTETSTIRELARAAAADIIAGRHTIVVTGTNDHAAKVNVAIRSHLADLGHVTTDAGVLLGRDGTYAGIGDLVQARRIDHQLGLVNRETYRVDKITPTGELKVTSTRTGNRHRMPAAYVETDVTLGYAMTAHGAEGATADTGHLLLSGSDSREAVYVGLTRGRASNTAWAITQQPGADPDPTGRGLLATALATPVDPLSTPAEHAAVDIDAADQQRANHAGTLLDLIEAETRIACRARLDRHLDELAAEGLLTDTDRARLGAEQGTEHLSRLLRAHEHTGADTAQVLRDAVADRRDLGDAKSVSQVLATRITVATNGLPAPAGLDPTPGGITQPEAERLDELHQLRNQRTADLGAQVAKDQPEWAVTALGPAPDAGAERDEWVQAAGTVAAYREATAWDHPDQPIGRCPGVHRPEHRHAWHHAYTAAGRPEHRRPEAEMTDGRLLTRVRAGRLARAAEPPAVYDQQRSAHAQAAHHTREADLATAAGDHTKAETHRQHADEYTAAAARYDDVAGARAEYRLYHAETYEAADTALAELTARGITPGAEPDRTTADEWLDADRDHVVEEDRHRPVTETDLPERHLEREGIAPVIDDTDAAAGSPRAETPQTTGPDERPQEVGQPVGQHQPSAAQGTDPVAGSGGEPDPRGRVPSPVVFVAEIAAAQARASGDALAAKQAQDAAQAVTEAEDEWHEHERRDRDRRRQQQQEADRAGEPATGGPVLETRGRDE
ncbi:MAG: MobF family relaxase [Nocardioides sp.]